MVRRKLNRWGLGCQHGSPSLSRQGGDSHSESTPDSPATAGGEPISAVCCIFDSPQPRTESPLSARCTSRLGLCWGWHRVYVADRVGVTLSGAREVRPSTTFCVSQPRPAALGGRPSAFGISAQRRFGRRGREAAITSSEDRRQPHLVVAHVWAPDARAHNKKSVPSRTRVPFLWRADLLLGLRLDQQLLDDVVEHAPSLPKEGCDIFRKGHRRLPFAPHAGGVPKLMVG